MGSEPSAARRYRVRVPGGDVSEPISEAELVRRLNDGTLPDSATVAIDGEDWHSVARTRGRELPKILMTVLESVHERVEAASEKDDVWAGAAPLLGLLPMPFGMVVTAALAVAGKAEVGDPASDARFNQLVRDELRAWGMRSCPTCRALCDVLQRQHVLPAPSSEAWLAVCSGCGTEL